MYVFCLHECLSTQHVLPGALEGQRKDSEPLELELQIVMNHLVGAENLTWILYKSNRCSLAAELSLS